jgi:hypothetical protein
MQCYKQPEGSVVCGYYACEYLRARRRFSKSWQLLKKSMNWWRKERITHRTITQTVAGICKFVTNECCHVDGTFFNKTSELATAEKYEKLHYWRNGELEMKDYKLPNLFS